MSTESVWVDPMDYNMQTDGPPYLPITAAQRVHARRFALREAAYYDVPIPPDDPHRSMSYLLALSRALSMIHQTAHWQSRGPTYYGDHLLFERIYNDSLGGIDALAERVIGLTRDPRYVDPVEQSKLVSQIVSQTCGSEPSPGVEELVQRSLRGESVFLKSLYLVKKFLESSNALTEGLDDLLQGLASKHEEFVYLLQQRAGSTTPDYDRRG